MKFQDSNFDIRATIFEEHALFFIMNLKALNKLKCYVLYHTTSLEELTSSAEMLYKMNQRLSLRLTLDISRQILSFLKTKDPALLII